MNTYAKYCPNVYCAKCDSEHEKGSVIQVTTKYGKENDCIVFNLLLTKDGFYYYSIVRSDGFDKREWAKRRAERMERASINSNKKSDEYYKKSNKDKDFLSLMEPIKVGHHSEKRHRKVIEDAHKNMGKSIELSDIAEKQKERAEYYESISSEINLSITNGF